MTSPKDVAQLTAVNDNLRSRATAELNTIFAQPNQNPQAVANRLAPEIARKYAHQTALVSAKWYEQARSEQNIPGKHYAGVPILNIDRNAIQNAISQAAEQHLQKDPPDMDAFKDAVAAQIDLATRDAANQTIVHNAYNDPANPLWAFVPVGDTCGFCHMRAAQGWHRSRKAKASHPHCDCEIVPHWGKNPTYPGYNPDFYQAEYDLAIKQLADEENTHPSPSQVANRMGQIFQKSQERTSPLPTPGVAGTSKPPQILTAASGESGNKAYWLRRQNELKIRIPSGVSLKPDEVLFAERFKKRGESFRWLRDDIIGLDENKLKSNDFKWPVKSGKQYELKSPRLPKWVSIRRGLHTAIIEGKLRIMVDIGTHPLSDSLKKAMVQYAQARKVKELWALSENGKTLHRLL